MSKIIIHSGTPRHSGRYPWGSGKNPQQRNKSFLGTVSELKKQGMSESEIAKGFGMTTDDFRSRRTLEKNEKRQEDYNMAFKLSAKGYSNVAIGKLMGRNESSVRSLLNPAIKERSEIIDNVTAIVKENVDQKKYLDVGVGIERQLGISRTKLKPILTSLEDKGYTVHTIKVPQLGTNHDTRLMVLVKPGVTYPELIANRNDIKMINDYSEDGGRSFLGLEPIRNIDSSRVGIRYAEQGGTDKDGLLELRRGVPELEMGKRYAQVRIGVDGTHYLKGMAMYSDNLPDGIDILFNTNKSSSVPKDKVMKPISDDADNPFGSIVRQKHYIDADGNTQLSALNKVGYKDDSGEEGAWGQWSKALSSQMLSKQSPALAKKQLALAYDIKKEEYDQIMRLTNPVVKQQLLDTFATDADSAAVHLKGAALPRQKTHVLLPIPSLRENEVYAPNYNQGEQVVLIRHPHGGIFEIPQLTVNNSNKEGKSLLGQAEDAIGINPKVAKQLSGADFDGDTVLVIPNPPHIGIKTAPALKSLIDFDPQAKYKAYEGMAKVGPKTGFSKPIQMGGISNLITDMTIKGASVEEITKAVKHSMVVIDAEKHNLDYKRSYIDNDIAALKTKYQGGANKGASTLLSKAKSDLRVDERSDRVYTDPVTGKKIYTNTGSSYRVYTDPVTGKKVYSNTGSKGKLVTNKTKTTRMAETDNAFELSSGTIMEARYAEHANKLKALGNAARKSSLEAGKLVYSPSAHTAYSKEVASLNAKLNIALRNAPYERQALLLANSIVSTKKAANPNMEKDELKKIKGMALVESRLRTGASKTSVDITDKEWEAIQAGAVTTTTLKKIMKNTDLDKLKALATPRESQPLMSPSKVARAQALMDSGHTQAEVAAALGVSVTTMSKALKK